MSDINIFNLPSDLFLIGLDLYEDQSSFVHRKTNQLQQCTEFVNKYPNFKSNFLEMIEIIKFLKSHFEIDFNQNLITFFEGFGEKRFSAIKCFLREGYSFAQASFIQLWTDRFIQDRLITFIVKSKFNETNDLIRKVFSLSQTVNWVQTDLNILNISNEEVFKVLLIKNSDPYQRFFESGYNLSRHTQPVDFYYIAKYMNSSTSIFSDYLFKKLYYYDFWCRSPIIFAFDKLSGVSNLSYEWKVKLLTGSKATNTKVLISSILLAFNKSNNLPKSEKEMKTLYSNICRMSQYKLEAKLLNITK